MKCVNCNRSGPANPTGKWVEFDMGSVIGCACCEMCRLQFCRRNDLVVAPASADLPEPPKHAKLGPGCPPVEPWERDPDLMRLAWGPDICRLEYLLYLADHDAIPELTETLVGGNYQPVPEPPKEAPVFSALPERGPQQSPQGRSPFWDFMFGSPLI